MQNHKLSPHFTYFEMVRTDHADLRLYNQEEGFKYLKPITATTLLLCEPIRTHFDKPVIIHSGFRCEPLNQRVKGSPNSLHKEGWAIDFHIKGIDREEVFNWIWKQSDICFHKVINEERGKSNWIHISFGNAKQAWTFKDGIYTKLN